MKRKEVEDVIGGKDAWENVDRADGEFCGISFILCFGGEREGREEQGGTGRKGLWDRGLGVDADGRRSIENRLPPRSISTLCTTSPKSLPLNPDIAPTLLQFPPYQTCPS